MYYKLVKNIEEIQKDPIKGGDFEHKLMMKWVSEKMGIVGENKGAATYSSTFEEDRSRFKANNEDCMMDTDVYQEMLVEYEEMMKEQQEKEMNRQLETYKETVGGKVTNV